MTLFASRYVYQGAIVVILIAVELAPGLAIQRRGALTAVALAVAGTVAMVVWGNHLRRESATARAAVGGSRHRSRPGGTRPPSVPRLQARRGHGRRLLPRPGTGTGGSPALTTAGCAVRPSRTAKPPTRCWRARSVGSCGLTSGPPRTRRRASERSGGCDGARVLDGRAGRPAATVELSPLSPSGVVFRTGAGGGILVGGRRFGDRFTVGIGALQGRAEMALAARSAAPRTRGISGPV